ncbi:MAG: sensor histidine kinase [Gemmatimonadetes bacterium]|nr:sensor histidine kinase [Gemmatimonadota bacterium]
MTTSAGELPPATARRLLGVPLLQKLVVADLAINVLAYLLMRSAPAEHGDEITLAVLFGTLALNAAMVYYALLPLRALETTAARVASGDLLARVPPSRFADRNIARIGATLNALLERLISDRARVQYLTAQVIEAADAERAHLARELHDSTAQSLSALEMLVTATWRETPSAGASEALHQRLAVMREIVTEALHEVRTLSHRVHPAALNHLGLADALRTLVRRTLEQSGVKGTVEARVDAPVSPRVASVVYRVAQEALANALRHGRPGEVKVRLSVDGAEAVLVVADDGAGFDVREAESRRSGMGLFVMRERLVLVDGDLTIESRPGKGTVVRAVAPNAAGGG